VPNSINCEIWNCNGLIRDQKQDMIVEVMEDNNIHVLSVSETHLRQGSNEDLACPRLIKPGLNHLRYEPLLPIHLYLDNEREWILIHENNSNIAIC